MAHEFIIMDSSNVITTYTEYEDIPLATLKHVISFKPDFGTLIDSNEILLESDTLDFGVTDNFITEPTITTEAIDLETATSTGELLLETGDKVIFEDLIVELRDGVHKLVPEDFADGEENHLVLETASDINIDDHYHLPTGEHHVEGDGHTEEEHREINLWQHKLQLLITQENTNASSL
jgi:hypothetical protein